MESSTLLKLLSEIGSNINENFKNIHGIIDVLKVGAKSLKEIEENFDMFLKSPSIDKSDSLASEENKKIIKDFFDNFNFWNDDININSFKIHCLFT